MLLDLIERIQSLDPAARSRLEVIFCYPGYHAMLIHTVAHKLWKKKHNLLARFISHLGRFFTGIEIHPGAKIGRRVFIDHGMGVVIGETSEVGDDVVIYQGVTLGAAAAARMGAVTRNQKRHPTIGRGVVVGSGASILGSVTVGENSRIASGAIVLNDIPPDSVVVSGAGKAVIKENTRIRD